MQYYRHQLVRGIGVGFFLFFQPKLKSFRLKQSFSKCRKCLKINFFFFHACQVMFLANWPQCVAENSKHLCIVFLCIVNMLVVDADVEYSCQAL